MALKTRTLLRGGLALALAAGFVIFGNAPRANADQILQYVERGYAPGTRPLLVTDDGSNTYFGTTSIAVSITLAGVNGSINGFVTFLGVNGNPALESSFPATTTTVGSGIRAKKQYDQDFVGQIKITSGVNGTGINYLTAIFSDVNNAANLSGVKSTTTASLQHNSSDRSILLFTSDIFSFASNGNEDLTIGINNIRNPPGSDPAHNLGVRLSGPSTGPGSDGTTFHGFDANETGTFSAVLSAVPEPASFIGAALAGCVMIGLRLRRRNAVA